MTRASVLAPRFFASRRAASLAGLTDDDHQGIGGQQESAIAELRGQLHPSWDPGQVLQNVLSGNADVVGRAAAHRDHLAGLRQNFRRQTQALRQKNAVLQGGMNGIRYGSGLLVDFLHHEVGKATPFRSIRIPLDLHGIQGNLLQVCVVEVDFSRRDPGHLKIADVVDAPGAV